MVTVYVAIGTTNVSNSVKEIRISLRSTEGIGNIKVTLDNTGGQYTNVFSYGQTINVAINGVTRRKGYVDVIRPVTRGKNDRIIEISGPDYGADLNYKIINKLYKPQPADDIIADMLAACSPVPVEIYFNNPSSAPEIQVETHGEFLVEAIREILEHVDYDAYVNNNKEWQMFPVGSIDSGIMLKSVSEALDNNILQPLERVEIDALELGNYIVIHGGEVEDGWTEFNAGDWLGGYTGNQLTNEELIVIAGLAAVKITKGEGVACSGKLTFPRFNLAYLDFSVFGSKPLSWWLYEDMEAPYQNIEQPQIILRDNQSPQRVISYVFSQRVARPKLQWHPLSVNVGSAVEIKGSGEDCWVGDADFNWKVKGAEIFGGSHVSYMIVDALKVPVKMLAIAQDVSGLARLQTLKREDIKIQNILDDVASKILAKRKNPVSMLKVVADGSAGLIDNIWKWIPGYKTVVNAPDDGISNEEFRFLEIIDIIRENANLGFDYVVEFLLVPVDASVDTQRLSYVARPELGLLRSFHERLRAKELEAERGYDWTLGLPQAIPEHKISEAQGTAFPANPYDGQRFYRTDLEAWFRYSESAASWVLAMGPKVGAKTSPLLGKDDVASASTVEYSVSVPQAQGSPVYYEKKRWTFPAVENVAHLLEKCTLQLKVGATGLPTAYAKIQVSENGVDWEDFGDVQTTETLDYVDKTISDTYSATENTQLIVRFLLGGTNDDPNQGGVVWMRECKITELGGFAKCQV